MLSSLCDSDDMRQLLCASSVCQRHEKFGTELIRRSAARCASRRQSCHTSVTSPPKGVAGQSNEPPRIAVCIAGAVRTLHHDVAFRTIKRHLIDALTSSLNANVTVFAILKKVDTAGSRASKSSGLIRRAQRELLDAALHHMQAERVHVDDVHAEGCTWTPWDGANGNDPRSLDNQLRMDHECYAAIDALESERRLQFTHIVRTRPDLVWYLPIQPVCEWPSTIGEAYHDWVSILPRHLAAKVLTEPHRLFQHVACGSSTAAANVSFFRGVEATRQELYARVGARVHTVRGQDPERFPAMILRAPSTDLALGDMGFACSGRWGRPLCRALGSENPHNRPGVGELRS